MRQQINNSDNQEMVQTLKRLQNKFFEGANKPGKFLANQLKRKKESSLINRLMVDGKRIDNQQEIKDAFLKFYSKLYKEEKIDEEELETYIQKINIKKISREEGEELDNPITQKEIMTAIESAKSGPGGYMAKFYKILKKEIVKQFQLLTNNILEGETIPNTWQEAITSIIPKEKQDIPDVKSFRPISLLNVDYKLFTKVIAERLKKNSESIY